MSCLFNSLDYFLHEGSNPIRQKICDYLQENGAILEGIDTHTVISFEEKDPSNYINRMRSTSTWGGAIEIQAACNLWKMRILVKNKRRQENTVIEFIPLHGTIEKTIALEWTGNHYEPVRNDT